MPALAERDEAMALQRSGIQQGSGAIRGRRVFTRPPLAPLPLRGDNGAERVVSKGRRSERRFGRSHGGAGSASSRRGVAGRFGRGKRCGQGPRGSAIRCLWPGEAALWRAPKTVGRISYCKSRREPLTVRCGKFEQWYPAEGRGQNG